MTVQELINKLQLVENKNTLLIDDYDGFYPEIKTVCKITLFSDDEGINLVDYKNDELYLPIECILISRCENPEVNFDSKNTIIKIE